MLSKLHFFPPHPLTVTVTRACRTKWILIRMKLRGNSINHPWNPDIAPMRSLSRKPEKPILNFVLPIIRTPIEILPIYRSYDIVGVSPTTWQDDLLLVLHLKSENVLNYSVWSHQHTRFPAHLILIVGCALWNPQVQIMWVRAAPAGLGLTLTVQVESKQRNRLLRCRRSCIGSEPSQQLQPCMLWSSGKQGHMLFYHLRVLRYDSVACIA